MKKIKIALTGGPCAGKTTALETIEEKFVEKGYQVLIVPEAATILINSGIKPFGNDSIDMFEFQRYVLDLQLSLENMAEKVAHTSNKDTIIVCDRGLMDSKAYVTEDEFQQLLAERGMSENDALERYDLAIHLRSAAFGKEEFYNLENKARTENIKQAREKDISTLNAWFLHNNLKIIGNDTDFETKIAKCLNEIYKNVSNNEIIQSQGKYLVEEVNLPNLQELNPITLKIEQYVIVDEEQEKLYRKSSKEDQTSYSLIIKENTDSSIRRTVKRKRISKEEYLTNMPIDCNPLRKTRCCFEFLDQYIKLDIFENGLFLLEVDDYDPNNHPHRIPTFITTSDDVSDNPNYRNSSLYFEQNKPAKQFKKK